jgi:hypothetical protein
VVEIFCDGGMFTDVEASLQVGNASPCRRSLK